jgi:hypothetical protein
MVAGFADRSIRARPIELPICAQRGSLAVLGVDASHVVPAELPSLLNRRAVAEGDRVVV